MKENVIRNKSIDFAIRIIRLYQQLVNVSREYVLSKQLLRSGTSIGANIREAINGQSSADFIHKLSIAQKECDETLYWLEILNKTEYLTDEDYKMYNAEADELLKIIRSIILTTKRKMLLA